MKTRLLIIIFLITGILFPTVFANSATIAFDGDPGDSENYPTVFYDCDDMSNPDIDLKAGYVINDEDKLYLRLNVYGSINPNDNLYLVYLDTDQNSSTGLTWNWWTLGADYRVFIDQSHIGLQKFMGDRCNEIWGWNENPGAVKEIDGGYSEGIMEFFVPRDDIGETAIFEATNTLFRIVPGDDAIPYYNAPPMTHYYGLRRPAKYKVIDNFEYPTDVDLRNAYHIETDSGAILELFSDSTEVYAGDYSAKLTYSLAGVGSSAKMVRNLPEPENWSKDKEISLWVKGYSGGTENFLLTIIEEDNDEWTFQNKFVLINDAWTKVIIPLTDLGGNLCMSNLGDGIKTLDKVVGYKITIQDEADDVCTLNEDRIYIDKLVRDNSGVSAPHSIPNIENYVVYYGWGRIDDLCKFDLAVIQPANYTVEEIARMKECGTKVLGYVSLGEDALQCLLTGDEKGPISSGVLTCNGYDSRHLDEDPKDNEPDRNPTWGGCFVNAGNKGWQDYVIGDQIKEIIDDKGCDGVFMDTIGIVGIEYSPYVWTSPGMISMIAAIREAYPNHYLMANRGFKLFNDFEQYVDALMFESFTSTFDFNTGEYNEWEGCDLLYNANLANGINIIRGYPNQTTIDVFALDYCATDDSECIEKSNQRANEFGFTPTSVSDIALSKMYMVNPANDLFAARTDNNSVALSWSAPPAYVEDANVGCYIIKRSTDGPIVTDKEWDKSDTVSNCVSPAAISFIDNEAPSCRIYYAMQASKIGGMPLVGRLQSSNRPIAVDGDVEDWKWLSVSPFVTDPDDMSNDEVDIKSGYATHDADYLFLRLDVHGNIDPNGNIYFIYLDTDQDNSTGLTWGWWAMGADYRIYIDQWNVGLQKFMGENQSDDTWGWDDTLYAVKIIPITYKNGTMEAAVLRADIGETAPGDTVNILWRTWPGDDSAPYFNDTPATYTLDADIISAINNFDSNVFKNKSMKKTLLNKMNVVMGMIGEGLYQDALGKLKNDVLKKTDGCTKSCEPDKNDWIVDCDAQRQVYPLVMQILDMLDEKLINN